MPSNDRYHGGNGVATIARTEVFSGQDALPGDRCREIFCIMVRARAMEERMIKMSKSGEGYFWIGGPAP
jgi:2-oxoisovalerate dehydrogenase E1 component alpha subunit